MKKSQQKFMQDLGKIIPEHDFQNDDSVHEFSEKYKSEKKILLSQIALRDIAKRSKKRKLLAAAACLAIICVPASAFAANKVFTDLELKKQQTNTYSYDYSFGSSDSDSSDTISISARSPLYHSLVKFQFSYIPDGYIENQKGSNKFSFNGEWSSNKNVSFMLLGVDDRSKLTYNSVLSTTDMTINGNEASFLYLNSTSESSFCKMLMVFYPEYGYALKVYAQNAVPDEELINMAEGIELVPCEKSESVAIMDTHNTAVNPDTSATAASYVNVVDESAFLEMNTPFSGISSSVAKMFSSSDLKYTVSNFEIRDTVSGLDEKYFGTNYENVKPYINPDGSLKPYVEKEISKGDGKTSLDTVVGETKKNLKLVYVTMKVKNTSNTAVSKIKLAPQICCLKNNAGVLSLPTIYSTKAVSSSGYSIYCDTPTMYDYDPQSGIVGKDLMMQYYIVQPQEEFEYHVAYIVEEPNMNNMVLFFNPHYYITTAWSNMAFMQTVIKLY